MPKKKVETISPSTLNYQEALLEIQQIVETIEKTDLPVDEVIKMVKRANELLAFCKKILEQSGESLVKLSASVAQ